MELIAALLTEAPNDVDFTLFENSKEVAFIKRYYNLYGTLPPRNVFESEFNTLLPTAFAPWSFYINKLKEEKFIREALPALTNFNNEYERDQKKALLDLREKLINLAEPQASLKPISIIKDTTRFENFKNQDNTRLPTGILPQDEACGGISKKDEFMVISARLGVGKSWIAHYITKSMCVAGYKVGLYSGEMSEDEVGARIDTLLSNISNFALTRGKAVDLTDHKAKLASITGDILVRTPKQLSRNATPSDLRRFAKEENLDCLVVDQLSLMMPDGNTRGMPAHELMASLSLQLKLLQQELQIPIIAVSQLNRAAAQQEADASNIAGSDRIGQDATLILALGRKDDGTLKIKVLKARSFRIPEQPWEFTWDIDKGILEPRLSAMDAVKAKVAQAKAKEATKALDNNDTQTSQQDDDDIW